MDTTKINFSILLAVSFLFYLAIPLAEAQEIESSPIRQDSILTEENREDTAQLADFFNRQGIQLNNPIKNPEKPLFRLTGRLSGRLTFYDANGIKDRYKNPSWYFSGVPTIRGENFQMPIRINAGNRKSFIGQYYNRLGFSPTYKWAKVHVGYNNVRFSPLTLNGRTFLGAGVELEPGIFRIGAVYGKFQNAEELIRDTLRGIPQAPAFNRKGYAFKFGLGKRHNYVDLIYFHAKDAPESLIVSDSSQNSFPKENAVIGLSSRQRIWKKLFLEVDGAVSAFTRNLQSDLPHFEEDTFEGVFENLIDPKLSTQYHYALQSALRLQTRYFGLETRYRRIDTDFQTMGTYYILDDVESLTLAPSFRLFDQKLRISGNYGWQRNNLNSLRPSKSVRQVGALNFFYRPNTRFNLRFHYSNFHFEQSKERLWFADSLLLSRVTNRLYARVYYTVKGKDINQTFFLGFNRQRLERDFKSINSTFQSTGGSFRYNLRLLHAGLSLGPGFQYYRFLFPGNTTERLSGNFRINQLLFDRKLQLTYHTAYTIQLLDNLKERTIWRQGFSIKYLISRPIHIRLFGNFVDSKAFAGTAFSFNETQLSLELTYQFF